LPRGVLFHNPVRKGLINNRYLSFDMVSVTEAKEIINNNTLALTPVKCELSVAGGKVLAEDVYAPINIPAFDQSSMDGYAFSFNEWQGHKKLRITGEIAAGSSEAVSLSRGTAVRIFTGAAVPAGADTVVMQEKVTRQNDELIIHDEILVAGTNVRKKGSEIQVGASHWKKIVFCLRPPLDF